MRPTKLAAYLDEAGENPEIGCATLKSCSIKYVALRHVWANNICSISDKSCQSLRDLLKANELTTIMIASDIGLVPTKDLANISNSNIDRVFAIAAYFGAPYIRIYAGIGEAIDINVYNWFGMITERAISANIIPLLEILPGSVVYKPAAIAPLFNKYKRWKLLYDPAQLIVRQSQDPFIKYWTLLKQYIGMIDIHDFKIGYGHKPAGYGDAKLHATLTDANSSNFSGWYCLEPALGRKHGSAMTRSDTFRTAIQALEDLGN